MDDFYRERISVHPSLSVRCTRFFYHAPLSLKTLDTSSPERLTSREDILEVFVILQAFPVEKFMKLDDWMMGSFIRI